MPRFIQNLRNSLKNRIPTGFFRTRYKKTTRFIRSKPLSSFFIILLLLFIVIVIGNFLNRPKPEKPVEALTRAVKTYNIGETPRATFQAKIDKAGVIKIVALGGGVVQKIYVTEGDEVDAGTQLVTLSTNYQGGNVMAIQARMAEAQYQNVADTFNQQNDAIQKQRDIANINHDSFNDNQAIATASANDTNTLINNNQTLLDQLNSQLTASPSSTAIASQISGLQGGQNQLRASLRGLQEQTNSGNPTGRLADTQRDLALEQLDLQAKALQLNKEVSRLQADLAEANAATMYPSSPFAGTVERIYVRVGQQINPGTVIAEIKSSDSEEHVTAVVQVPATIARNISPFDASMLHIDDKSYALRPTFISQEATDGSLYSLIFALPADKGIAATDGEYVNIDIPVDSIDTSAAVPFVPLDAIYQTQDKNYLLVVQDHKAVTREVTLGNIFGSFAEINKGLSSGDQVILDRNIVAGDKVTTE